MFRFLRNRRYAHLRRIDVKILWPSCRKMVPDLDHAKAAFAAHAFQDRAWMALGEEGITMAVGVSCHGMRGGELTMAEVQKELVNRYRAGEVSVKGAVA